MIYTEHFLHSIYGKPEPKPLDIPVEVDLSGLPEAERLALIEARQRHQQSLLEQLQEVVGQLQAAGTDGAEQQAQACQQLKAALQNKFARA